MHAADTFSHMEQESLLALHVACSGIMPYHPRSPTRRHLLVLTQQQMTAGVPGAESPGADGGAEQPVGGPGGGAGGCGPWHLHSPHGWPCPHARQIHPEGQAVTALLLQRSKDSASMADSTCIMANPVPTAKPNSKNDLKLLAATPESPSVTKWVVITVGL